MRGVLFDDHEVELHEDTALLGGSFQGTDARGRLRGWEPGVLRLFYKHVADHPAPVVLDIGASTGNYSLLTTLHPRMRAWAFEPQPSVLAVLIHNLKLNGVTQRVRPVGLALTDRAGSGRLNIPAARNLSGLACLGQPKRFAEAREMTVMCSPLDEHVASTQRIDFMKIDTEGAELLVLKGAERTIRQWKPQILVECDPRNTAQLGYDADMIPALLESWGATVEWVGRTDIWVSWHE